MNRSAGVLVFLLAACMRSTQTTPPEPVSPPTNNRPEIPGIVSARSWTLIPTPAISRYLSNGTTALELQSDTAATRASITTTASFSLSASQETGFTQIHGTLNSFSAQTSDKIVKTDQPSGLPLVFSGRLISGGFHLDSINDQSPGTGDCSNHDLNSLSIIRQSLIAVPSVLTPGLTWVDSSTVPACSGSIPLQLTTVRAYTVVGESSKDGSPVIVIDRADRFTASGEGAQGQHRVTVLSLGTGSARINVDRISGLLNSSNVELQARITVTTSGRTQVFSQTVKERTVLVDS